MSAPRVAAKLNRKLDAIQLALSGKTWGWITDPPPIAPHERRKSGGKLTQPQIDAIRALRAKGKGIVELGKMFGVSHSNISIVCRDMPKTRKVRGNLQFTDDQIREIRRLGAKKAMKRKTIARRFGITENTVYCIITRRSYAHVE